MAKEINFIRPQEVYEDGKSVVRYRSYDGKDKFVQASDSPEGGGGGIVVKSNLDRNEIGWVDQNDILTKVKNPFIIEDIEITNDGLGLISVTTNNHIIRREEDGWYESDWNSSSKKIDGTNSSTLSNDPLIVDAVKKATEGMLYGAPNGGTLTASGVRLKVAEYRVSRFNTLMTIEGFKVQINNFPDPSNFANFHI